MIQHLDEILPRRFALQRNSDASGVSGTGIVAYGVVFGDGSVAMRWNTIIGSTAFFQRAEDVLTIHGHEGATEIVWIDNETTN